MHWLRFVVLLLAMSLLAASAAAQQPLIEPGREREVLTLFAPYRLGSEIAAGHKLWNVEVRPSYIDVYVRGPRGEQRCVRLRHPSAAQTSNDKTQSFAIERNLDVRADVSDALIGKIRANDHGGFWQQPPRPAASPASVKPASPPPRRRLLSWLLAGFALGWSVLALVRAARTSQQVSWHEQIAPAAIILAAGVVALLVPERLPVHEHNSFLARSDCAYDVRCDEDPRLPGWLPPTFHVYGVLLRSLPYRLPTLGLVSLALSLLSLLLLYTLLARLLAHFDRAEVGRRIGCFAIAFLAVQPAWLRIAVGDTFWPYSLCCLLAAGHALLSALGSGKLPAALAAAAWFALATLSNTVLLTLVPLALIAPLAWRRPSELGLRRAATALAVFVALVLPYFVTGYRQAFVRGGATLTSGGLPELFSRIFHNFYVYPFELSLSPAPLALYSVCALFALRRAWRPLLPFVYVYLATAPFLCIWAGHPLRQTYPVGFINAFPDLYPLSVLAAFGADWLVARISLARQRWAALIAIVLPIACVPFAREGVAFVTGKRVLERELEQISRSFDVLPAHDVLVEGPHLQPALPGVDYQGDPIEVIFPRGEYAYVLAQRSMQPAPVITSDRLGLDGIPRPGARVLLYVGSKLRSFLRPEIEAGMVPESLERPALVELRRRYTLEPVHEFEIETAQHPAINVRLGADRVARVQLGFYWLVPRESAAAR